MCFEEAIGDVDQSSNAQVAIFQVQLHQLLAFKDDFIQHFADSWIDKYDAWDSNLFHCVGLVADTLDYLPHYLGRHLQVR